MNKSLEDLIKPRSVITIMLFGTYCVIVLCSKTAPQELIIINRALLAFWFGEKIFNYAKNGGAK